MNGTGMLGRVFALAGDAEQAEFLNEAGRTLRVVCKVHDGWEDMQFSRIADQLDADGKRFLRELAAHVEARSQTP